MIDTLDKIMSSWPIGLLELLADLSILAALAQWVWGMTWMTFELKSTGKTYKVRRKDFDVQTVTNGVAKDENKTQLPEEIRNEIISITNNPLRIVTGEKNKGLKGEQGDKKK